MSKSKKERWLARVHIADQSATATARDSSTASGEKEGLPMQSAGPTSEATTGPFDTASATPQSARRAASGSSCVCSHPRDGLAASGRMVCRGCEQLKHIHGMCSGNRHLRDPLLRRHCGACGSRAASVSGGFASSSSARQSRQQEQDQFRACSGHGIQAAFTALVSFAGARKCKGT